MSCILCCRQQRKIPEAGETDTAETASLRTELDLARRQVYAEMAKVTELQQRCNAQSAKGHEMDASQVSTGMGMHRK